MIIVLLLGTATAAWGAGREIKISLIEYSVDKSDMQPSLSPDRWIRLFRLDSAMILPFRTTQSRGGWSRTAWTTVSQSMTTRSAAPPSRMP